MILKIFVLILLKIKVNLASYLIQTICIKIYLADKKANTQLIFNMLKLLSYNNLNYIHVLFLKSFMELNNFMNLKMTLPFIFN